MESWIPRESFEKVTSATGSKCCKESKYGSGLKTVVKLKWREILLRYKFTTDIEFSRASSFLLN